MKDLNKRVEEIQALFKKHRRLDLKELPTRTIFIDPLLGSLGWDVRDPDEVELEYPTIDGKSFPYRPVSAVLFRGGQGHFHHFSGQQRRCDRHLRSDGGRPFLRTSHH